jgi:hypothetical protein
MVPQRRDRARFHGHFARLAVLRRADDVARHGTPHHQPPAHQVESEAPDNHLMTPPSQFESPICLVALIEDERRPNAGFSDSEGGEVGVRLDLRLQLPHRLNEGPTRVAQRC